MAIDDLRAATIVHFLAQLLAGIDPHRGVGILAEGEVDETEQRAQFLVTGTVLHREEREKVGKLRCRLLWRLVSSRIRKEGRRPVVESIAVMAGELNALITLGRDIQNPAINDRPTYGGSGEDPCDE